MPLPIKFVSSIVVEDRRFLEIPIEQLTLQELRAALVFTLDQRLKEREHERRRIIFQPDA